MMSFLSSAKTLLLCWSSPVQCRLLFLETLLWSLPSWVLSRGGGGRRVVPTNARGRPAAGAKAKAKTRPRSAKRHRHSRKRFTRRRHWENLHLSLWPASAAARPFCLRKLKTEHGLRGVRRHRNKTENHPTGWITAPNDRSRPA